jgi:hypothetical protein
MRITMHPTPKQTYHIMTASHIELKRHVSIHEEILQKKLIYLIQKFVLRFY